MFLQFPELGKLLVFRRLDGYGLGYWLTMIFGGADMVLEIRNRHSGEPRKHTMKAGKSAAIVLKNFMQDGWYDFELAARGFGRHFAGKFCNRSVARWHFFPTGLLFQGSTSASRLSRLCHKRRTHSFCLP